MVAVGVVDTLALLVVLELLEVVERRQGPLVVVLDVEEKWERDVGVEGEEVVMGTVETMMTTMTPTRMFHSLRSRWIRLLELPCSTTAETVGQSDSSEGESILRELL